MAGLEGSYPLALISDSRHDQEAGHRFDRTQSSPHGRGRGGDRLTAL